MKEHHHEHDLRMSNRMLPSIDQRSTKIRTTGHGKAVDLDIDDFLWCAAQAFRSKDEREARSALMQQLERTSARTSSAVDEAIAFVETSDKRMAELERSLRRDL
jgi:hypothetical protein